MDGEDLYAEITKGNFTSLHYGYMIRLRPGDYSAANIRYADSLWGARRRARSMLRAATRLRGEERFREEVRL